MQNVEQTIYAQLANSPRTLTLIGQINDWIDPTANLNAYYNLIWNLETAQGYGLDVWGRIVGVQRVINVASVDYLGFQQGVPGIDSFDAGILYSGEPSTSNYALSDQSFLTLIYAKAYANICNGSIPAINQILLTLFPGRGNCWVSDGENMTMTYNFAFMLTSVETAIVTSSGVLPRPPGVSVSVVQNA